MDSFYSRSELEHIGFATIGKNVLLRHLLLSLSCLFGIVSGVPIDAEVVHIC